MCQQAPACIAVILGTPAFSIQALCAALPASSSYQPATGTCRHFAAPPEAHVFCSIHELLFIKALWYHPHYSHKGNWGMDLIRSRKEVLALVERQPGSLKFDAVSLVLVVVSTMSPRTHAALLGINQVPAFFSNFPQITTRTSLLLPQNNVSLITTWADNYSDLRPN